jgi:hypothetical protein
MPTTISRTQLYERVWRQPIVHVAKDFGISDVGLRKICKRNNIPTPPAGYWAKVAHGKRVTVIKLPDADLERPIVIWRGGGGDEPEDVAKARTAALAAVTQGRAAGVDHPVVGRTFAKLRAAKPNRDGLVRSAGAKLISTALRPESLERAEQIVRQLVAAGEAAGFELKSGLDAMAWHTGGEVVGFELAEAADQVEHIATEKELAAHENWQRDREETHKRFGYWSNYGEPKIPKWEQCYNGRIAIILEKVRIRSEQDPWGKPIRGTFADSRTRDVSRMLPSIIGAIAATAAAKINNSAYEERRRVAEALARQRWEEEERRRYQWERVGKVVKDLIELEEKAQGIQRLLDRIRVGDTLPSRLAQFVETVEAQLAEIDRKLGIEELERRLEMAHLFGDRE